VNLFQPWSAGGGMSWDYLTSLVAASAAVVAVTNTVNRVLFPGRVEAPWWTGLLVAEALMIYGAYRGALPAAPPSPTSPLPLPDVLFRGAVLFGYAMGANHASAALVARWLPSPRDEAWLRPWGGHAMPAPAQRRTA
jgi:hypothetical protein